MATLDLTFTRRALPGPPPKLRADAAHVWRIDLGAPMAGRANVLSADEMSRVLAFRHEGARSSFQMARIALRNILATYTGVAPARLPIVIDARGKPQLDLPDAPLFNLSHSGGLALLAITRAGAVGVDVELRRETPRFEDLAARFFARNESRALSAIPEAQRLDAFFACWTRKEAFVKADGAGIANMLQDFEVSLAPDAPARVLSVKGDADAALNTTLHAFRPAEDAWGALCVMAPDVTVSGYDFVAD